MKKLHIIYTPFTGVGLHGGFRGDQWFAHRIDIFKRYTLKSLTNQSNKDFIHWFSFRPEEIVNWRVHALEDYLISIGYPHIFTFNGLMYWDDKFSNYNLRTKLRNALMMLWDMWIYKEFKSFSQLWKYTWDNKNHSLYSRLALSLREMLDKTGEDYQWVYMTRIDSDDMFHREAINLIQSQEPKYKRALVFEDGYIYNVNTGQLGTWNPPTNPPFHTIIFPKEMFFNPEEHEMYYGDFKTHEDILEVFDCITLDMNKYMVSFHGKHISTAWDQDILRRTRHKAKGYCYTTSGRNISTHWESRTTKAKNFMIGSEITDEKEKEQILKDFGID